MINSAALRGRTLGDFVISAALEEAEKVIEAESCWKLDAKQSAAFVKRLLEDREPHPRLRRAFAEHESWESGE